MEQPKPKYRTLAIFSSLFLGTAFVWYTANTLLGVQSSKSTFIYTPAEPAASAKPTGPGEAQPGKGASGPAQQGPEPPASPPTP
jgi:hypothetical protein